MYEDCLEKHCCNRTPSGCSDYCYRSPENTVVAENPVCLIPELIEKIEALNCNASVEEIINKVTETYPEIKYLQGRPGDIGKPGSGLEFTWEGTRLKCRVIGTENWSYSPSLLGMPGSPGTPGLPGTKGDPGFSPSITIKTNNDSEYILNITNKNGSYDTPNLKNKDFEFLFMLGSMLDEGLSSETKTEFITKLINITETDLGFPALLKPVALTVLLSGNNDVCLFCSNVNLTVSNELIYKFNNNINIDNQQLNFEVNFTINSSHTDLTINYNLTEIEDTQPLLISGTNIKTINGTSILGSGDIVLTTTETDPTVPDWAKTATKPTYTSTEVGAAATSHSHIINDITDLQTALNAKLDTLEVPLPNESVLPSSVLHVNSSYEYELGLLSTSDISGLTTALTNKQNLINKYTITLASGDWSANAQTKTAVLVGATSYVIVGPSLASEEAWTEFGVRCSGQTSNSLTFTCETTPDVDIIVGAVSI